MPSPSTVREKYDNIYRAINALLQEVIDVNTVSREVRYAYLQRAVPAVWHDIANTKNPLRSDEALARCIEEYEKTPARLTTQEGKLDMTLGQVEEWKRRFICNFLREQYFDTAIELGSGWGHRLVDLWLSYPPINNSVSTYVACELSNKGVGCTELLGTLFQDMPLTAMQFDMLEPDLSALNFDTNRVLIYSVHAIEQLPEVPSHLFDILLNAFPDIRGVHFEPITFQLPNQASINEERYKFDLNKAAQADQNGNLFEVLSNHPGLKITNIQPAVWQISQGHSVSVVEWQSI